MSFLNTLNAAGSALGYFNDRLSLIGKNIASTQTPGYDRQRQNSVDSFYQTLSQANAVAGGSAAAGGVKDGGIETIFTVGELAETGQSTDIAIDGRGWFPMQDSTTGAFRLSRVGSFKLDGDGFLRDPGGHQLLGIQGQAPAFEVSLDAQNRLIFQVDPTVANSTPGATGSVLKLDWQGGTFSDASLNFATIAEAGGRVFPSTADGSFLTVGIFDRGLSNLNNGGGLNVGTAFTSYEALESALSTGGLSLAQADRALFDANGRAGLSVNGVNYQTVSQLRTALNNGDATVGELNAAIANLQSGSLSTGWSSFDELNAGLTAGLFDEDDLNRALATTPLTLGGQTFDGTVGNQWSDLEAMMPVNPSTGRPYALADIEATSPKALGLNVETDGTINWRFSNGSEAPAAWVRLAEVRDPSSLEAVGQSLFAINDTDNLIGDWQNNAPGENGRGQLIGGSLEMSNVDLTTEFADMMASQRSYQASSKMLSVMDELLSSVIQLRR